MDFFRKSKNNSKKPKWSKLLSEGFLPNTSYRIPGFNTELKEYGSDTTRKITYKFNNLGYRGEDFNPDAKKYIYVAGSSHAYGTGIFEEETYGHQFKKIYSKENNLNENEVNLLNFSVGGASNDYLVRTIIANCNHNKPDILICEFSYKKNREFISEKESLFFCPSLPLTDLSLLEHPLMSDTNLFVDTLKNMLLLQYYCKLNNIEYIFSWLSYHTIPEYFEIIKETHKFLFEEIDFDSFLDKELKEIQIDYAADYVTHKEKAHAGPKTHKIYADLLFKKYLELYKK